MNLHERFCWYDAAHKAGEDRTPQEEYGDLVTWASCARGTNPKIFDELTSWLRGAGEWSDGEIGENGKYLMDKVFGGFWSRTGCSGPGSLPWCLQAW